MVITLILTSEMLRNDTNVQINPELVKFPAVNLKLILPKSKRKNN